MKFPLSLALAALLLLAAAGGGYRWWRQTTTPGPYDDFARCLGEKGLKFYGAYWCPHCAAQKKRFGKSEKYLPYVECATPGSNDLKSECQEIGVKAFPTWTGPNNFRVESEMELGDLAERSGCPLQHQNQ